MSSTLSFSGDDESLEILRTHDPVIFLLNGPPRSGKDTAAMWLQEKYNGRLMKFADPIKQAVTAIYHGGDRAEFDKYDTAELKDKPQDVYFLKTCRECQIGVSENFLKPFHNDTQIFGRFFANTIERMSPSQAQGPFFVSDSGFRGESEFLVKRYGPKKIFLFRIFRDGYSFEKDSRNYVTLKDLQVSEFDIQNVEGNKPAFFAALEHIVDHCLKNAANAS